MRAILNTRTFKGCFPSPPGGCCLAEILWPRLSLHFPWEQQGLGVRLLACCCHTWACTELLLGAETSTFVLCLTHPDLQLGQAGQPGSSLLSALPRFGHGRFLLEQT